MAIVDGPGRPTVEITIPEHDGSVTRLRLDDVVTLQFTYQPHLEDVTTFGDSHPVHIEVGPRLVRLEVTSYNATWLADDGKKKEPPNELELSRRFGWAR